MDDQQADQDNNTNPEAPATGTEKTSDQAMLEGVRQRALEALTPVLSNIEDMSPERKFDICISAMRLTDNKALAETALEAALKIGEGGTKAEALVELINEINYLTNN